MAESSSVLHPALQALASSVALPAWRSVELGVYVVYPSRKFVSPKVRLMIDFLVNAFSVPAGPA